MYYTNNDENIFTQRECTLRTLNVAAETGVEARAQRARHVRLNHRMNITGGPRTGFCLNPLANKEREGGGPFEVFQGIRNWRDFIIHPLQIF